MLQDCFDSTDWDVFKTAAMREDCTVDLEEYASVDTGYISTCIDNVVPTKCCKTYPNQNPGLAVMYGPCSVPAPLHLPLVTLRATKRPDMTYVDPSAKPRDSID